MIEEVLKSYLVSLGVQIDKPGFNQMKTTLDQTTGVVSSATSSWAKNFVKASGIIATSIASVSASIVGLMTSVAKQDLAMEKYARNMMINKKSAVEMKTAIDALGESVQDIQLTPELFGRYKALLSDGKQMKVGGDYEATMKNFRDLVFEFTRLKQEASYALQWVGYYLMKYLSKPLDDAKKSFKNINDSIIKNMPVWTDKVARALVYIINIGIHFWDLLKSIGKTVKDIWMSFPRGVKIATASLAGFFMLLKASPLNRMIALISSLLLLVDDYFGYMEGKNAAMSGVWNKLNGFIDSSKIKFKELGRELRPFWNQFIDSMESAWTGAKNLGNEFSKWTEKTSKSQAFSNFTQSTKRLGNAFYELGSGIINFVMSAFNSFFDAMKKYGIVEKFNGVMERLLGLYLELKNALSWCIETIADWFKELSKSEVLMDFIDALGELLGVLLELIDAIVELVTVAFSGFFGEIEKTQKVYTFRNALRTIVKIVTALIRGFSWLIRKIKDLFKLIAESEKFKKFWETQAKSIKLFSDLLFEALGRVGKLGRALIELVKGNYKVAVSLAGEALGFGGSKAFASGRKADASVTEREMWELAKQVSAKTGIKAELIYAQWWHESAGFTSRLARENYNFGGVTQEEPNGEENKQPDGNNYYMVFDSPQSWADYYSRYIMHPDFSEARKAENTEAFAWGLKSGDYYTDDVDNYNLGLKNGISNIPADNPSDAMQEQHWSEEYADKLSETSQEKSGFVESLGGGVRKGIEGVADVVGGIGRWMRDGFSNVDPQTVQAMNTSFTPSYTSNYGGNVTNYYKVDVGGVKVENSNASAKDIGNAVGRGAVSALGSKADYISQNRALTGLQV